jgi:DNA-binding transcriptional MocR family regulator
VSLLLTAAKESDEALNQLFRALADGTRRDILARSLTETPSVSDLAARYEMSFAAVQKHVAVLERAGLIQSVQTAASNWSPPTTRGSSALASSSNTSNPFGASAWRSSTMFFYRKEN